MLKARVTRIAYVLSLSGAMIAGVIGPVCGSAQESTQESTTWTGGAMNMKGAPIEKSTAPDASTESEARQSLVTVPAAQPPTEIEIPRIPAMRGFRQLADSQEFKTMFKELITAKVPVLYQTMMMVENGAATGFIGSVNAMQGVVSNLSESQQLYIKILEMGGDTSGGQRRAYVKSMVESLKDKNKGVWPAALMYASGDDTKKDTDADFEKFTSHPRGGSSSAELARQSSAMGDSSSGTGTGGTTPDDTKASNNGGASGRTEGFNLIDELFTPREGENSENILNDLKGAWKQWIGNFKTTPKNVNDLQVGRINENADIVEEKNVYEPATALENHGTECKNIYNYHLHKTRVKTWKSLNKVMHDYCDFKRDSKNYFSELFKKERAEQNIDEEAWRYVQSQDVKVTINLVDQFFKLMVIRKPWEEWTAEDCNVFSGDEGTMPIPQGKKCEDVNDAALFKQNEGDGRQSFDDCSDRERPCLRNVLLYKIAKFIAASKVNRYYANLWYAGMQRTTEPYQSYWLTRLTCAQLGLAQNSVGVCEAGEELEQRADEVFEDWLVFSNKLSKLAQGQGGSTIFRPTENSLSNFTAGAAGGETP